VCQTRLSNLDFGLEFLPPFGAKLFEYFQTSMTEIEEHFSTLWICDHFQFKESPWYEGWTALSYIAGRFPNFKYGNLVLSAGYRNPAMLGKMAATLQDLTNGNFVLGLGAGWHEEEYLSYGYSFPSAKERVDRLEEAVKLIKDLWSKSPSSYSGKYYRTEDAYCVPKPKTRIPILIAGEGERILKITAREADAWNGVGPVTRYEAILRRLWHNCDLIGRKQSEIALTCLLPLDFRMSPPGDPNRSEISTPEDAVNEIQRLTDLKVSHVQTRFQDVETFKLFCKNVAPSFSS
jgi:alkanesulfonate monooxygenase SsuD/methylene tetrahydromethanopterin reductase-like flavin-dependent oxidoreductase (luciferase family)